MKLKPNPALWITQLIIASVFCLPIPLLLVLGSHQQPDVAIAAPLWPRQVLAALCLFCFAVFLTYIRRQYLIHLTEEGVSFPTLTGVRLMPWADVNKAVLSRWRGRTFLLLYGNSGKRANLALDAYKEADAVLSKIRSWLPVAIQES